MRLSLLAVLFAAVLATAPQSAWGQDAAVTYPVASPPDAATGLALEQSPSQLAPAPILAPAILPTPAPAFLDVQLPATLATPMAVEAQKAQVAQQPEKNATQVELQRQQIELLNRMIKLMSKQLEQQGPLVDQLQTKVATLEARSKQAALRDQELANGFSNMTEQQDAAQRYGTMLPAPLRELFLPSYTNETPLSIYGTLAVGYSRINGDAGTAANGAGRPSTPGGFYFGEFTPDFFLKLNDWIFLSAEIGIGSDGSVSAGSFAEADFFIYDWLQITAGRFVAPIGWYNLRLNNPWVNKLPGDAPGSGPMLWQQVLPPMSLLGLDASGSFYLFNSPLKFEYNAYVSNGLNLTPGTAGKPTLSELANLENMTNTFNIITNDKAFGGIL